ncbi:MAG TPA: response regulator [Myxococcaceae bacterium]|nr:response regulator [Myxococcaceae bacterium]
MAEPSPTAVSGVDGPTPRRVLFVDDRVKDVKGLQSVLQRQCRHWDLTFVHSGSEALDRLESSGFDIVVADLEQTEMDGVALLGEVKRRYPFVTRLLWSPGGGCRSRPEVAHHFLAGPCDANTLRIAIERTCALHGQLAEPRVRVLVGPMDRLPSPPAVYVELNTASADPRIGLAELARIVSRDPAVAAKVLQVVNSAFFALREPVGSIQQAVAYLGSELLKALVLTTGIFGSLSKLQIEGFSLDRFQRLAFLCARLARRIAPDRRRGEEAFTAALLHNVGQLVLARTYPHRYAEVLKSLPGLPVCEAEAGVFGVTHATVGAYLLGAWGLPLELVEAVAYHHRTELFVLGDLTVPASLHIADAMVTELLDPDNGSSLDVDLVARAGMNVDVDGWRALAEQEFAPFRD